MRIKASDIRLYRAELNERILGASTKEFTRFFGLDPDVYQEGVISARNRELMLLVGSVVLRCDEGISYHLDRCVAKGCTRQEIYEALNISLVIGGSAVVPHLQYAFEVLENLPNPSSAEVVTPPGELPVE